MTLELKCNAADFLPTLRYKLICTNTLLSAKSEKAI
jgi:hypothetical protein